ncbi:Putative binding-protein-dependent transport systems inner membrane component [Sodalis praecaptivus]|uniref:sn-glycerol-3-phosphate transport system permease protein UgpE n=1 Tax=Sodalis praecaptivus TaxID=1239307 RepID=W0HYN1_9GAMM|nr:carbohydrate ABC transporter permease [Sodalis praecaptivus]AHF77263.1 Putative binding-protein-dependent transport systems inner membrane component [Sodalis praecaptivus]
MAAIQAIEPDETRGVSRRPLALYRRRGRRWLATAAALIISLLFAIPFIWLVASAFRPVSQTFQASVDLWTFVPRTLTLENFQAAFSRGFAVNVFNSLWVTGVSAAVGTLLAILAAFPLAVMRFPGRNALFVVVVFAFMIPFEMVALPLTTVFSQLGLANTLTALIVPGLVHGLAIFNLRQFFLSIPREQREAAWLDGAGWWRILFQIYLPLVRPAVIGTAMILAMAQWNAWLWPSLIITDNGKQTGAVAIGLQDSAYTQNYGLAFAEVFILALIPALLIFFGQRTFTRSLSHTGGK